MALGAGAKQSSSGMLWGHLEPGLGVLQGDSERGFGVLGGGPRGRFWGFREAGAKLWGATGPRARFWGAEGGMEQSFGVLEVYAVQV